MLKLLLCLLLVGMGGGVGYALCRRYQARVRQLEKCDQMLSRMQSCLSVERLTTRELFEQAAKSESLAELTFLGETANALQTDVNFPEVWRVSLEKSRGQLALTAEDYLVLEGLSEVIGAYDAASQSEALELSRGLLRMNTEQAREQSRTNGKLSCSLGLLGGIALAILLL